MNLLQESLFCTWLSRFWDAVIARFQTSVCCRLCRAVRRAWLNSFCYRLWCARDLLSAQMAGSYVCRGVQWCLNFIPSRLGRLAGRHAALFDSSFFLQSFRFGAVPLLSYFLLALLVIPQNYWNNLYSLVLAFGVLLLCWIGGIYSKRQQFSLQPVGIYPLLFFFIWMLSCLWSVNFTYSFRFVFFALTCLLVVLTVVSSVNTQGELLRLMLFAAAGLCVCCLYAVFQRLTGVQANASLTDLSLNADMPGRVYSFFENPNAYANILVYFAPLMLAMSFYAPRRWQKCLFLLAFVLCGGALIMTYARGGWLALAATMLVLMLLLWPKWVPLVLVLACCAMPFLPSTILNRLLTIFNPADTSIGSRGYIYSAMLRLIRDNWLFGVGIGTTNLKYAVDVSGVFHTTTFPFIHAHDIYLELWGEGGLGCILAYLLGTFFPFRNAVRASRKNTLPPLLRGAAAGCAAGVVGALVFGITDYAWSYPRVMVLYFFLFALLLATLKLIKAYTANDSTEKETNTL